MNVAVNLGGKILNGIAVILIRRVSEATVISDLLNQGINNVVLVDAIRAIRFIVKLCSYEIKISEHSGIKRLFCVCSFLLESGNVLLSLLSLESRLCLSSLFILSGELLSGVISLLLGLFLRLELLYVNNLSDNGIFISLIFLDLLFLSLYLKLLSSAKIVGNESRDECAECILAVNDRLVADNGFGNRTLGLLVHILNVSELLETVAIRILVVCNLLINIVFTQCCSLLAVFVEHTLHIIASCVLAILLSEGVYVTSLAMLHRAIVEITLEFQLLGNIVRDLRINNALNGGLIVIVLILNVLVNRSVLIHIVLTQCYGVCIIIVKHTLHLIASCVLALSSVESVKLKCLADCLSIIVHLTLEFLFLSKFVGSTEIYERIARILGSRYVAVCCRSFVSDGVRLVICSLAVAVKLCKLIRFVIFLGNYIFVVGHKTCFIQLLVILDIIGQ